MPRKIKMANEESQTADTDKQTYSVSINSDFAQKSPDATTCIAKLTLIPTLFGMGIGAFCVAAGLYWLYQGYIQTVPLFSITLPGGTDITIDNAPAGVVIVMIGAIICYLFRYKFDIK